MGWLSCRDWRNWICAGWRRLSHRNGLQGLKLGGASSTVELFLRETWVLRPAVMELAKGARLRRRPLQKPAGPSEGAATRAGETQEDGASPAPTTGSDWCLVWGCDFGFGDFFGDLGRSGELGTVPAAA